MSSSSKLHHSRWITSHCKKPVYNIPPTPFHTQKIFTTPSSFLLKVSSPNNWCYINDSRDWAVISTLWSWQRLHQLSLCMQHLCYRFLPSPFITQRGEKTSSECLRQSPLQHNFSALLCTNSRKLSQWFLANHLHKVLRVIKLNFDLAF